ncbi:ATP-grasp domain-containing protein [Hyphomonas sp. WL0036]|uniref:acetyl/propionyl/methylcrotonyl-CoA carboxylase subunit alpha n=1 Tax=Hyphomonas sediminis TaxID=2866160 RepID=UPI001C7EDA47|nr:biotin carboxylase N-terminal domain-containing protein [Hyphomonas sediminis]MBY9067252.1 ATP-grasp domain-containing protein [Hyphomonas sediminis]
MITKLLIANRGEIACRIMDTCRALGIETVAVFSEADRAAMHVREADEAVCIGPAPAPESYLRGDAIIAAARATGADAVHPGYGFLSENAGFAEAVVAAGLIWVGPPPAAIRSMGPKDEAKRIAEDAGVPVLPGYRGEAQDIATLTKAAEGIGYPLLIKAVAGGGGRGIRQVSKAGELEGELVSAVREAESAFGDGRVMLEKLVERPRHIEVQVFGDSHGNVVHLYERDCSLQRRRQKVLEEAPAPGMPEDVRKAMTDAAVKLAEAVGYQGAGTVEFIVDGSKPLAKDTFWFLEMNTRLQVEHPVTELVTGQDLVEWQLIVASGGKLPLKQKEIELNGHAIEARICAEDPAEGFRPGAGVILEFGLLEEPDGELVRWDAGFETGDRVPSNYDSMIAKLIVYGDHRDEALERLTDTLAHTQLAGVPSNAGFLRRCALSEEFQSGTHHVNWIGENVDVLTAVPPEHHDAAVNAVASLLLDEEPGLSPWAINDGFRLNAPARRTVVLAADGEAEMVEAGIAMPEDVPFPLVTDISPRRFAVTCGGDTFLVTVPEYSADAEAALGGDAVKAPMPGKLLTLVAQPGQSVARGDTLAVLEAMKMEHSLAAPRDGVVEAVHASPGQQVAEGDLLVSLVEE